MPYYEKRLQWRLCFVSKRPPIKHRWRFVGLTMATNNRRGRCENDVQYLNMELPRESVQPIIDDAWLFKFLSHSHGP